MLRYFIVVICALPLTLGQFSDIMYLKSVLERPKLIVSETCERSLKQFLNNLEENPADDNYALQMLDATSKIPVGLLSYNFGEMGNFDQCINAASADNLIKGKYCLGRISINNRTSSNVNLTQNQVIWNNLLDAISPGIRMVGSSPSWAICLPSNCSNNDILNILSVSETIGLNFTQLSCQTKEDVYPPLDTWAIFGIVFLAVIVYMLVICTIYDIYCIRMNKKPIHPILIIFSMFTNGKKLFTMNRGSSELSCLHGIRVISMVWIIAAHCFSIYPQGPAFNSKDFVGATDLPESMILASANLACDTFLLVGGTLVVYVFFKYNGFEKFNINIFQYYLHRYIRVTPVMFGGIITSAALLKYMGSGPNWFYISNVFGGNCRNYWWSALLYVQNYVNVNKQCIGNSWYLDIDMQLYVLSPIFLYLLMRQPKIGFALISFCTLGTIGISFYIAYTEELSGITTTYNLKTPQQTYMDDYYLRTHTRAGPWLIGLVLGYILVREKRVLFPSPRINKNMIMLFWIACLVTLGMCMFGGHSTLRGTDYNRLGNAFYIALIRPTWSLCLAWIIWACAMDYGGFINKLLSLPIFQVFNKFTYSMYVLHVTMLYMVVFSKKISIYLTVFDLFYNFLGMFTLVFCVSILWVLAFESPMFALEKIIYNKKT